MALQHGGLMVVDGGKESKGEAVRSSDNNQWCRDGRHPLMVVQRHGGRGQDAATAIVNSGGRD
jgi:hypothetical protein